MKNLTSSPTVDCWENKIKKITGTTLKHFESGV
jgi:hypothetical protein